MNSPSKDIADFLVEQSALALSLGVDLFIGREPDKPTNCVTIYDTPGYSPDTTMDSKIYERPSIQIRVRDVDYATGWALIHAIMNLLHGRAQETLGGTLYTVITCSGSPSFLFWNENKHAVFILNVEMQRR